MSFNKIIQKELSQRAPSYVSCFTFHSVGLQAIKQRFKTVEINEYKVFDIVKDFTECNDDIDLINNICDTVAFCKYGLLDSPRQIEEIIINFGIDLCGLEKDQFIKLVIKSLGKDKALINKIDFNDMCWFHHIYDLKLGQYDYVYVDEYQDLNKSQMVMAKKLCKKDGGRIILAGDSKQDLYSWRLSDKSIVEELNKDSTTKTLYLPISYRCPKQIVELVKPWVPDFTCPENTKDGEINEISLSEMYKTAKPGCFILSRTNAPLIKICMTFIRQGVKANIKGRDVSKQLNLLIRKSKKKQIPAFLSWLEKWKEDEVAKCIQKGFKPDIILDKYECLVELCDEFSSLKEVSDKINELFNDTDEKNIIILSTVHRCKGLERDNVFLLHWTFKSWFNNILPGDEKYENEELNIAYVAATRSKNKLCLVSKTI